MSFNEFFNYLVIKFGSAQIKSCFESPVMNRSPTSAICRLDATRRHRPHPHESTSSAVIQVEIGIHL